MDIILQVYLFLYSVKTSNHSDVTTVKRFLELETEQLSADNNSMAPSSKVHSSNSNKSWVVIYGFLWKLKNDLYHKTKGKMKLLDNKS